MFASLKQRFGGPAGTASTLQADLRRVTESSVIEVPQELLGIIVEASQHGEEERRTIMGHLRECLSESTVRRWKRIHAALILIEALLKHGSPELVYETAEGKHFDLVQRLSLLEHFENVSDRRVQNMIRTHATALRAEVVPRLETAADSERPVKKDTTAGIDNASTCSPSIAPSLSSGNSSSFGAEDIPKLPVRPQGLMILNGVVAVGHRDDTTSESSGGEESKGKAVAYKTHTRRTARERESRVAGGPSPAAVPTAAVKAPTAMTDLLGL